MATRDEVAWSQFYDRLELNASNVEDILATGLRLDCLIWEAMDPPSVPRPPTFQERHLRVIDRILAATAATEHAMAAVHQSLQDLPHHSPEYTGSRPMGEALDIFG